MNAFRRSVHHATQMQPSMSRQNAWSVLKERIATVKPSAKDLQAIHAERPWAFAPDVLCLYTSKTNGKTVNIRWPEKPERNVNVEMPLNTNFYSLQVYSVYYAILNAYTYKENHVALYTPSDIVTKVANGIYNGNKEKKTYDKISRRMVDNDVIMVRVSHLSPLAMKVMEIDDVSSLKCSHNVSESVFRDNNQSALIMV